MSPHSTDPLSAEIEELRALVRLQQERIDSLSRRVEKRARNAPLARRDVIGRAVAATLGAAFVARPTLAQVSGASQVPGQVAAGHGLILEGYTGVGNTALGSRAGELLDPDDVSSARWNTAIGVEALMAAWPGGGGQYGSAQRSTAVGRGALRDMVDGVYNDAFGADAGRHCNRANRNTFLGNNAGKWVGALDPQGDAHPWWVGTGVTDIENQGSRNVMIGRNSGHTGVTAQSCVAVGYNAGAGWGTNYATTVVGRNSLLVNRSASRSVAMGAFAMTNSSSAGDDTVAIGYEALRSAAGNNNVAVGTYAGRDNQGGQNVFIGEQAGLENQAGSDNVMLGRHAGLMNNGSGNIFVGRMAGLSSTASNRLIVHNTSSIAPFLEGSMGDQSLWWLRVRGDVEPNADGAWSLGSPSRRWKEVWAQDGTINTSDARLKEDVADETLGLAFIEALRPVIWKWKDGSDRNDHRGLLAQDVRELADSLSGGREFSAVVERGGALGLREREFLGPLIKAVQELSARVRELQAERA